MRRFFLEQPPVSDTVLVQADEARHIIKVLRLKRGHEIVLFDRTGNAYSGIIANVRDGAVTVTITETFVAQADPHCRIVLLQAVLKSQKMDAIVQKSTELGCQRIMPFFSSRCIPRWDAEKAAQKQHHWQQIAVSAVKQSGVRQVMAVDLPSSFEKALKAAGQGDLNILLWEEEQSVRFGDLLENRKPDQGIACAVGPEGGFSVHEVDQARRNGFVTAGLGKSILRAETVPLALLSIIGYETGCIG